MPYVSRVTKKYFMLDKAKGFWQRGNYLFLALTDKNISELKEAQKPEVSNLIKEDIDRIANVYLE